MIYYSFEDIKPAYKISKITFRELEGIEKLRWNKGDNPNSFRYVIPETTLKLEKMKSRKIEGKEPIYNPESQPDYYTNLWREQDERRQEWALFCAERKTRTCNSYIENYTVYLNSPEWKEKARQRLELDGYRCTKCRSAINLRVHHITYASLGHEDIENDLITLCNDCHKKLHEVDLRKKHDSGIF